MTELAHGSNVAGLETTAHFDGTTDEFVIHTPNLGATKWWIGGAAQTATHCSVFAQLIVKGKRYGTKTFIVPLRDPKSFQLLPVSTLAISERRWVVTVSTTGYIHSPMSHSSCLHAHEAHPGHSRWRGARASPSSSSPTALFSGRTAMVADAANTAKRRLPSRSDTLLHDDSSSRTRTPSSRPQIIDYPIHQRRSCSRRSGRCFRLHRTRAPASVRRDLAGPRVPGAW